MSGDSSETMFDPGLYAELLGAQAALARAQANAPPAPAAVRDAETRRLTSAQASVEPPTRELPLRGERPAAEPPPAPAPPAPAPPPPPEARFVALGSPEDFDDEYTAVADDVFDAIQEKPAVVLDAPPQRDTFDEVATGEVRLPARSAREEEVAELDDADLLEDDGALADEVESLDAADAIEEVDDVEELEELEELESPFPSRTSRPPPPPGSAPPPRR